MQTFIGYRFYAPEGFFKAQVPTKAGFYKLALIDLNRIDVVEKGIAERKAFWWDINIDWYIEELKKNFDKTPPVILEEFKDKFYSVDGHHRITAALELGKTTILAFVTEVEELTYPRRELQEKES